MFLLFRVGLHFQVNQPFFFSGGGGKETFSIVGNYIDMEATTLVLFSKHQFLTEVFDRPCSGHGSQWCREFLACFGTSWSRMATNG